MTTHAGESEAQAQDWNGHVAEIQRRMRIHLRGVDSADIEDCAQRAALSLLRFTRRVGCPHSPNGLIEVIVRRTAQTFLRGRYRRRRRLAVVDLIEELADRDERDLLDLEEEVAWKAMQVLEYFRQKDAPCVELAEARSRGEDLKQLADRLAQSHDMLRQRWSRCVRGLRIVISKGVLSWAPPLTKGRK